MIKTTLKRHEPVQINDNSGLRNVEEQNRERPEEEMRRPELGSRADPTGANHKKNLREDQIEKTERFLQRSAVLFDVLLRAFECGSHREIG